MSQAPLRFRYGPLTVYLQPLESVPDLAQVARRLPASTAAMWLDSARPHPLTGRWSMLGWDPWLSLIARNGQLTLRTSAATHRYRANPLEALRELLRRYRAPGQPTAYGRAIGLMGFLSYELNRWIESLPPPRAAGPMPPEMVWCSMKTVLLVDHEEDRAWLLSVVDPHENAGVARQQAQAALEGALARIDPAIAPPSFLAKARTGGDTVVQQPMGRQDVAPTGAGVPVPQAPRPDRGGLPVGLHEAASAEESHMRPAEMSASACLEPTMNQAAFERMVSQALEHIRAGDIFQANVAQRFIGSWQGPSLPLYTALRRLNPSPFACWLAWDDLSVVSCSPERLVRVQESRVDTRPIAGTRPRGMTADEDAVNSLELLLSEKERAEHIMLVDLARNDLGRVCRAGSVQVNELMSLEAYSHVLHIVSDVAGVARSGVDAVDVIRAVFPGGTITGCPKVRCMQLIRELEPVPRGLYTGSLGYLGFDGTLDLNIAIRTIVIQGQQLSLHAGAGIVADSIPEREYQETLAKARALMSAVQELQGCRP